MALPSRDMQAAIAVTRFGLGGRPGEIATITGDPQGWLTSQIRPQGADQPQQNPDMAAQRIVDTMGYQEPIRENRANSASASPASMAAKARLRDAGYQDFISRVQLGATTPAGFRERWALFWANHFTVSGTKYVTIPIVGPFEQEVIRPRVFGRFEDMLLASSMHPAMLFYLDQDQSVGPHSVNALKASRNPKARVRGLNENLGREIMELHTVGVNAGYSQADVTEFSLALTGWRVGGPTVPPARQGLYWFETDSHEPGPRKVMGRSYPEGGQDQATAVLKNLAAHPATARHVCTKIARHFVSDAPPQALVDRLTTSWTSSGGDLSKVARTLVASPEVWDPHPAKFKTPYEFLVSSWRATATPPSTFSEVGPPLRAMGQQMFKPQSPKGWDDEVAFWASPDGIIKRIDWAQRYAARTSKVAGPLDMNALARDALGERLTPLAAEAIARSETRPEALAVLLMSPEFQRR